jgi:hypothetical protein
MASLIIVLLLSTHSFITQLFPRGRVLRDIEGSICCARIPRLLWALRDEASFLFSARIPRLKSRVLRDEE